ncbi:Bypass of stop codon protein 6 [Colletotrichum orbiculare MAFF 240422]|uniref:Bypass of stop codon protein 6 n=1 Tax=Colletotrichum orbiculare (strain 104-T / ATCC 96160 / CBS 514.97 / LARS 414 / MAFF 240422) TaxID=1213857 RepID=A0A484G5N1_COLOR|nr:Bypass of stop codon protein 6 [Colletotrichum orbiculare MAFF 240422]
MTVQPITETQAAEKAVEVPPATEFAAPDRGDSPLRETWHHPRSNVFRVAACFWSLLNLGTFDAAYGALLPYLQQSYSVSYVTVSLVFLSPLVGGAHILSAVINILKPPFPALVVSFMIAGLGNGLSDAAWNAWIGNLERSNELLGYLHAAYGVGGVFSPLVATAMITRAALAWNTFYYVVLGISVVEMLALTVTFWDHTGRRYREQMAQSQGTDDKPVSMRTTLTSLPEARIAWLSALFVLIYIGVEVSVGGWVVEFMLDVRHGEAFASGMCATGYWLGMTLGRIILPFVTRLIGPLWAVSMYLGLAMVAELLFWLVPNFYASAIAVAFQGFFIGPMFPHAIAVDS